MAHFEPSITSRETLLFQNHPNPCIKDYGYQPQWLNAWAHFNNDDEFKTAAAPSSFSLGATTSVLSLLHVEIYYMMLEYLNVDDLEAMRRTQQALNLRVCSYLPYQTLREQLPTLLRAVVSTAAARNWKALELLQAAQIEDCSACGDTAPLIHLLSLDRLCLRCCVIDEHSEMITVQSAIDCLEIPPYLALRLAKLRNVQPPSSPSREQGVYSGFLVRFCHAIGLASEYHDKPGRELDAKARRKYRKLREYPAFDGEDDNDEEDFYMNLFAPSRYIQPYRNADFGAARAYVPFLRVSHSLSHSVWCKGCEKAYASYVLLWNRFFLGDNFGDPRIEIDRESLMRIVSHERRAYSEEDFEEHTSECLGIIHMLSGFGLEARCETLELILG